MRKVKFPAGSLIMNGTPAAIWNPFALNFANMSGWSVYHTDTPGASKPGALTVRKPLDFIMSRHSFPSAHAASAAFLNPISFVSSAASRNKFSASVGIVV